MLIQKILNVLHDIDIDILTLTETWNPESKKEKFQPKKLDGYHEHIGTSGSSKSGSM